MMGALLPLIFLKAVLFIRFFPIGFIAPVQPIARGTAMRNLTFSLVVIAETSIMDYANNIWHTKPVKVEEKKSAPKAEKKPAEKKPAEKKVSEKKPAAKKSKTAKRGSKAPIIYCLLKFPAVCS